MITISKLLQPRSFLFPKKFSNAKSPVIRGFKSVKDKKTISNLSTKSEKPAEKLVSKNPTVGRNLLKCTLFTGGFCGVVYFEAAVNQYLNNGQAKYLQEKVDDYWQSLKRSVHKQGELRTAINDWWNGQSKGQKTFWFICFFNTFVYGCWRIPRLQPFMYNYFTFSPFARVVCWPMFLSTFSHYNFLHLGANMFVLHSFSGPICHRMGYEDFLAYYLSAGVITSLGSAVVKVMSGTVGASLGASGAILGLLGYFCTINPDAKLGIIFLPFFHFSAQTALYALIGFDLAGIIFRFRLFDHGAHLSGTFLGMFYGKYGEEMWIKQKKKIWRELDEVDRDD